MLMNLKEKCDAPECNPTVCRKVRNAPQLNPDRILIKGSVCGVKIDAIEDPLMKEIRYLDKLVDELAKGKAMEKIKRTNK